MTLSLEHQSGILSKLLSCGVSLLAEVFRLRTTLPEDISDVSKSRFKSILLEFSYFETPIEFDQKIEDNVGLKDLDEEFTELHRGYVLDFSKFMHRLCSFIFEFAEYTQKYATVDVLLDTEWNKIHSQRADVLYHLGIILIFLDEKFLASSREALFVAGQRLGDKFASTHFETSISLLRERKDVFENCFVHLGVDRKFAENVLEYVRTFSLIQTQDVGMSSRKSSLVYIALWFIPNVLRDEGPLMRTLVDAFFGDQWILPLHFELTANVLQKWKNYKPAILALRGVLRQEHVASIVQQKIEILKSNKLPSGLLSLEEFEYYKKTLVVCNSALKWIILHFGDLERFKKISILFDPFKYLLTLIKFEYKFKQSALFTIKNKTAQADKLKERISSSIDQVVHILDRSQESWKTKVSAWLGKINDKLSAIGVVNPKSVNVIESVKLKLEEISEITSDDQRVINQYLEVILKNLDSLKTVILLNFDFLNTLDTQCDADYLWNCISGWVPKLESLLQSEPVMVKYFFFKLKSPIEVKVAGMSTEKSEAIAVFYHKILETYLKRIVQAIPRGVFVELEELQSLLIDDEYCFIEKSKVKNIIQSERRRRLAEKTCKISKLSLASQFKRSNDPYQ
ncbi:unnamed protein product [Bursaphelenchus xylophilus]|uniref:(pine wood nematode) hypothetical protein n=1 Tax=Bursaphelenchus xylophilus TaxID=6326 RepID=A0A811K3F1_BURXY|nr:unnamed protein product [Bursaphelenchus xylophilus]CAG9085432.1 unnamed protein product [Bursaphelenchus xylophilus]